ncbi:hypothetical protein AYO21_05865 [Fonsecaea monophora]|uniref:Peroxisomal biogenesis factor 11 n=1 Tax=Fonsecaea monophora TaxID=254056 RepID=A0A177F968_9EURO|nr:hypothetical protein AYO21_05865 [Fonsecaea monophora]OAG39992.1 hypothetical protein AYO21_05865 [Fonsecaea monophora]
MLKVGVEKSLKFLQSTSQIAATVGYLSPDEAALWLTAKDQFALGEKLLPESPMSYIPLLNALMLLSQRLVADRVALQHADFSVSSNGSTAGTRLLGTWRPWAVTAQIEALKFWFYALSASVALSLYELLFVYPDPASSKNNNNQSANEKKEKTTSPVVEKTSRKGGAVDEFNEPEQTKPRNPPTAKRNAIFRQLVIDTCDLLIPAAAVGWFPLDPVTVGAAGSVSALLGGSDVWYRVNA